MSLSTFLRSYHSFTNDEMQQIEASFEEMTVEDRHLLAEADKVCSRLYFVIKGVLRIASTNDKGVDVTHYFYKEDQFCTILQSFNERTPTPSFIQACCNATVISITNERLAQLIKQVPVLHEVLENIHQQKLLEKVNVKNLYIGANALEIYRRFLVSQPDIALRVSQKDIAEYLGITPQSFSRIRRQL